MMAKSSYSGRFHGRILFLAVFIVIGLFLRRSSAQPSEPVLTHPASQEASSLPSGMQEKVSLDLRSIEVTDALKYLATKGGLNLSVSKNVSGRVNLFLTDIPIRDVFDLVLRSNELAYDRQGEIFNVMTEVEYRALYGRKFSDLRQVKTFRLQYAIPQQAFNLLDTLKSEIGRLLVDEDSGTVLVMDTPEKLEKMEEALATMEQGGTIRLFDLKYAKAKDIEERLKDQLEIHKLGFVRADERSNQVIVKTFPERMKEVERLIAGLDRKTREVLINAKIVKVNLSNKLTAGIDWNTVFANRKFHGMDAGPVEGSSSFRTTTTGTAPSEVTAVRRVPFLKEATLFGTKIRGGELLFGTLARDGYELFRYLETLGETKVISSPRLLVTENHEAHIHVGTREAYITSTTTTGQTTSTTAEQVQFIDVGIQLSVTPIINEDGYVTMKIKPEVSSVVRTLETPSKNKIPIVDTSTAETNVLVKDGSTVIIGGLRKNQKQFSNDQIPWIGRIPLVGELFKRRNKDDEVDELVVFITPHVVTGDELISGDEGEFGGAVKSFHDYAPLIEREEQDPPSDVPAPMEPVPFKLHLREKLRGYPGVR